MQDREGLEERSLQSDRLDSWKEIAAYIRRSERTVRRWERSGGLPVHRVSGPKRATVYAFKSEVDSWWADGGRELDKGSGNAFFEETRARFKPTQGQLAATAAAALAVVTILFVSSGRRGALSPDPGLTQLTFHTGSSTFVAVSRDRQLVAYSSDRGGSYLKLWVQPVSGGEARRLTHGAATDRQPDFSPDGSTIAFRSEWRGGGIYLISAAGGEPRLVSDRGYHPRYSPDGKWIAFSDGRLMIIPAGGGEPRGVAADYFLIDGPPIWTSDSKHLIFLGSPVLSGRSEGFLDWFVASLESGNTVQTGVYAMLRHQGMSPSRPLTYPSDRFGDSVIFSGKLGDATNLWQIRIPSGTWKATEPARRITFGQGKDSHPRVSSGGRLYFTAEQSITHLWKLPVDANRGKVNGPLQQVTHDASIRPGLRGARPRISPDGRKLVFCSRQRGNPDIWMREIETGRERPLTNTNWPEEQPMFSPDGLRVAYVRSNNQGGQSSAYAVEVNGGAPRLLCENCGNLMDWSPDGRHILFGTGQPQRIMLLDVETGRKSEFLAQPAKSLAQAVFSSAKPWIALLTGDDELYIVPFRDKNPPPIEQWIRLATDAENTSPPQWSPDGTLVYFLSLRDDHRCLWAQRFDPDQGKASTAAFAVQHFHGNQHYPWIGSSVSLARDSLVLTLTDITASIWATELR